MMTTLHIFRDNDLLVRLRSSVADAMTSRADVSFNLDKLMKDALLASVYAETLRLYVQVYVTRCSPHNDVKVNNWVLPQNKVCMISSYVAHMDENVWNTRDGAYPLDTFWAERFLLDPNDPSSGPLKESACGTARRSKLPLSDGKIFSMDGLEGSWIPYGGKHLAMRACDSALIAALGGYGVCPGRHFAKRQIFLTCAMMITMFDVEILADSQGLEMDSSGFGLGTQKPKYKIPFRIKRRTLNRAYS